MTALAAAEAMELCASVARSWPSLAAVAEIQTARVSSGLSEAVGSHHFYCPLQSAASVLCTSSQSCWLSAELP